MTHATAYYDIFEYAKDLKKAGVPEAQIEAQVKFEKAKDDIIHGNSVTRHDIELVQKDIESVRKEIESAKKDTIIWLSGIIGTIVTFGPVLSKYLLRLIN